MEKKQVVSVPAQFFNALFKTPTHQICFPIFLIFVLCGLSACLSDEQEPVPCDSSEIDWFMEITVQDEDAFDFRLPIFRSNEPVNMKLKLLGGAGNMCLNQYSVEVQLIQDNSLSNSSERVVETLWSDEVNVLDSFLLNEHFTLPAGCGTYALLATMRDAQGDIVAENKSQFFHVQQTVDTERAFFIGIYSPYHGQEMIKGNPIPYVLNFEEITIAGFEGKIEILDENNQLIKLIKEPGSLPSVMWGHLILNTPGKYTIKASVWSFHPSTDEPHYYNIASNEFIIKD